MAYTRKQIRDITGLPDKTLRWLLDKLDIQPIDINRNLLGGPVYIYDDSVIQHLHAYIFQRRILKEERSKGKRCRGGCERYFPEEELNSQQICNRCRRYAWLHNEVCHHDPLNQKPDIAVVCELQSLLNSFK